MDTRHGSTGRSAFFRRWVLGLVTAAFAVTSAGCARAEAEKHLPNTVASTSPEEAGRYLVAVAGCNDCHTDGWMESNGQIAESEWLTGSVVGFRGPWGTTYPPNLRLGVQSLTEDQWVDMLATRTGLPPMPWPSVNRMSDDDRRAIYRFLRSLGPKGELRAAPLGPDVEPTGPWFDFVPKNLPTVVDR